MVGLDRQTVVGAALKKLAGKLRLGVQGIGRDNAAADVQIVENAHGGFDFIGFCTDEPLFKHQAVVRVEDVEDVPGFRCGSALACRLDRLTVDGNDSATVGGLKQRFRKPTSLYTHSVPRFSADF